MGVSPEVRGRGLGLALLCQAVKSLKESGVQDMVIDWTTLLDFYEKAGFLPWKAYLGYVQELQC